MNLAEDEIKQRLIRLYNLEKLHSVARERIVCLEKENKKLRIRIKELEDKNKDQNTRIEALSFQFEQIKNKLFGKKPIVERIFHKKEKVIRDISSYQRPIPEKITSTKLHAVTKCNHCHELLKKKSIRVFFEEDIPLPIQKTVIKHEVWIGYCNTCKIQSSGYPIPSKKVVLGYNVKKYICILSIANRFSHNQIQNHLKDVFDLGISIGEIGNILNTEANDLRPAYQALKESVISQTATHYDETSWDVQKEEQGKFAWVATGTENNDTVFSLGRSRGKGNIYDIGKAKLGISDDYGAYRNTFDEHQLCWAHPNRKLRDLAESTEVPKEKRENCKNTYLQFSTLYKDIRKYPDGGISTSMGMKFQTIFKSITDVHSLDPTALTKLKISLLKNTQKYFTFLKHPGIPIDNNKAERALRHLVLKRKISFGSKTQRGAETTSILASVILSLKWNNPDGWYKKYIQLGG